MCRARAREQRGGQCRWGQYRSHGPLRGPGWLASPPVRHSLLLAPPPSCRSRNRPSTTHPRLIHTDLPACTPRPRGARPPAPHTMSAARQPRCGHAAIGPLLHNIAEVPIHGHTRRCISGGKQHLDIPSILLSYHNSRGSSCSSSRILSTAPSAFRGCSANRRKPVRDRFTTAFFRNSPDRTGRIAQPTPSASNARA